MPQSLPSWLRKRSAERSESVKIDDDSPWVTPFCTSIASSIEPTSMT